MPFREKIFVKALTERPETARLMMRVFEPTWLAEAPLQPVLAEIYEFTLKSGIPPSVGTLREIFKKKNSTYYENRMKLVLDELDAQQPTASDVLYEVEQARSIAVTRSFGQLIYSERMRALLDEGEAVELMEDLNKWRRSFEGDGEAVEMNVREAIDHLIQQRAFEANENVWIKTGIPFLDEWAGGGLQRTETGIILAPTGSGKSVILTIIAHNIAKQLERNVLLITNELTMRQEAERFLSRITGHALHEVRQDPLHAYHGLERHWASGMHKHLRLVEKLQEFDTDYIEGVVAKYTNLYGWKPDVIVIDYMERMRPTVSGVRRDQSWNWLKYIAQDIVRMSKRGNYLVWTAAQLNRSGYDSKAEMSLAHAQGSMMHLQEVDFIAIMRKIRQTDPTSKMDLLQFACRKARSAKADQSTLYVEADLSRMYITENIRTEIVKGEAVANEEGTPWCSKGSDGQERQDADMGPSSSVGKNG